MARDKAIDTSPRFLAVDMEKQLLQVVSSMPYITCLTTNSRRMLAPSRQAGRSG